MLNGFGKIQIYLRNKVNTPQCTTELREVVHADAAKSQVDVGKWLISTREI